MPGHNYNIKQAILKGKNLKTPFSFNPNYTVVVLFEIFQFEFHTKRSLNFSGISGIIDSGIDGKWPNGIYSFFANASCSSTPSCPVKI